ncbi:hypothetical protein E2C01_036799 [Portunus trituberculatus]|uniref:Uncharacterized protein n=1 Tax=Portunus trituberculatus TaxID=210409 RepID=A0A5B7F7N3_PORTR|nr:hypothetical protein [Portunus trituberculatus]
MTVISPPRLHLAECTILRSTPHHHPPRHALLSLPPRPLPAGQRGTA